MTIIRTTLYNL